MDPRFFVAGGAVARTVRLPDGSSHILYFKPLSALDVQALRERAPSEAEGDAYAPTRRLIELSLVTEQGERVLEDGGAGRLTAAAFQALATPAAEVCGMVPPEIDGGKG
jgi:hypothetical protein